MERTQPVITINNAAVTTDNTAGIMSIDKRTIIKIVIHAAMITLDLE